MTPADRAEAPIVEQFDDWRAIVETFSEFIPVRDAPPSAIRAIVNWAQRIAGGDDEEGGVLLKDDRAYIDEIAEHYDSYGRFARTFANAALN